MSSKNYALASTVRFHVSGFFPAGFVKETTNCVPYVQEAVDAANAAGGGTVVMPPGDSYFVGNFTPIESGSRAVDGVTIKSNVTVEPFDSSTRIVQAPNLCYAFAGRFRSTPLDINNTENVCFRGLVFHMPIRPQDPAGGLVEFREQLSIFLDSINGALIENCVFIGWSGDAISLGPVYPGSAAPFPAGNVQNVIIRNNVFDGVDKNTRNGISVIDGINVEIYGNTFKQIALSVQPGAIDIEPENTNSIIKNISIHHNTFSDIQGSAGAVTLALNYGGWVTPPDNISVTDNIFNNCISPYAFYAVGRDGASATVMAADSPTNVSFERNKYTANSVTRSRTLALKGITGINICDNEFSGCADGYLGFTGASAGPIADLVLSGNTFKRCKVYSADSGVGLFQVQGNILGGVVTNNRFIDSGRWLNVGTPSGMTILAFEVKSQNSRHLLIADNYISSNGSTYTSAYYPFHWPSANAMANSATIDVHRNILIGAEETNLADSILAKARGSLAREELRFPGTQLSSANANVLDDYDEDLAGAVWTPVLTSFTNVGSPTVTGTITKIGRLVYGQVKIVPATSVACVAATSYITLPYNVRGGGSAAAWMSDNGSFLGANNGYMPDANNQLYPPAWVASGTTKVISFMYHTDT